MTTLAIKTSGFSTVKSETPFFELIESLHNIAIIRRTAVGRLTAARVWFEDKCIPEPNSGCWLWTAALDTIGYGQAAFEGKHYPAHRLSYLLFKGPIPEGLNVLHVCDTRACINPDHLRLGTQKENIIDAIRKGRWQRSGKYANRVHLNREQVLAIRKDRRKNTIVGKEYGIARNTVSNIKHCKVYGWVREDGKENFYSDYSSVPGETLIISGNFRPRNKLTPDQVRFIRSSNLRQVELAKMFHVTKAAIHLIKNFKRQSWVTEAE